MTLTLERCENCNGQTPDRDGAGLCHNCRPAPEAPADEQLAADLAHRAAQMWERARRLRMRATEISNAADRLGLRSLELTGDYQRPMSVVLNDPTTKASELTANLVIAERAEFLLDTDDSEAVAEVANLIDENPHLFAMRFLRLERQTEELRQQFAASTLGAYVSEVTP